jgi:hypothetical protein
MGVILRMKTPTAPVPAGRLKIDLFVFHFLPSKQPPPPPPPKVCVLYSYACTGASSPPSAAAPAPLPPAPFPPRSRRRVSRRSASCLFTNSFAAHDIPSPSGGRAGV